MENIGRHTGKGGRGQGFTLIEVLISLLIIAFGLVAVIEGLSASSRLVFKSKQYQDVGELAEREMELLMLQMDKVRRLGDGGEVEYTREWGDVSYRCKVRVKAYDLYPEKGGEEKGEGIPFYRVFLTVSAGEEHPRSFTLETSFAKEGIVDWRQSRSLGMGRGRVHFGGAPGGPANRGPGLPLPFPFPQGRR